jgi:hypothetical protein
VVSRQAEGALAFWRLGFAAGAASAWDAAQRERRAERERIMRRDLRAVVDVLARAMLEGKVPAMSPGLAALCEEYQPCTCLPAYTERGLVDPFCRHDDRDDLVRAVVQYLAGEADG